LARLDNLYAFLILVRCRPQNMPRFGMLDRAKT
jgi:hypothetical protein